MYSRAWPSSFIRVEQGPGGKTVAEVSDLYRTAITPAGYAFSIWGIIYVSGIAYVVYLTMHESVAERIGPVVAVNFVLQTAWLFLWTRELILLSHIAICAMLGTAMAMYIDGLSDMKSWDWGYFWQVMFFLGVYTAWLCVATTASFASLFTPRDHPSDLLGLSPSIWARIILPVCTAVLIALSIGYRDLLFALVGVWSLWAIAVKQHTDPRYPGDESVVRVAIVCAGACVLAAIAALTLRILDVRY